MSDGADEEQAHHARGPEREGPRVTPSDPNRRFARFLLGLGGLSMLWFVSLAWLATSDTGVLVSAGVFGVALAVLCVTLLPGVRASRPGSARRWLVSMALWGLCFAVFLWAGLLWNREETFYWLLTAPLVAGPAFIGAQVEGRA